MRKFSVMCSACANKNHLLILADTQSARSENNLIRVRLRKYMMTLFNKVSIETVTQWIEGAESFM